MHSKSVDRISSGILTHEVDLSPKYAALFEQSHPKTARPVSQDIVKAWGKFLPATWTTSVYAWQSDYGNTSSDELLYEDGWDLPGCESTLYTCIWRVRMHLGFSLAWGRLFVRLCSTLRRRRDRELRTDHLRIFILMTRIVCQNVIILLRNHGWRLLGRHHTMSLAWGGLPKIVQNTSVWAWSADYNESSSDVYCMKKVFRQIAWALCIYIFEDCRQIFRILWCNKVKFIPGCVVHFGVGKIVDCGRNIFGCFNTWGMIFTRMWISHGYVRLKIVWMMSQDVKKAWGRLFTAPCGPLRCKCGISWQNVLGRTVKWR